MNLRRDFSKSLRLLLIIGVVLGSLAFFGASEAIPVTSTQLSILPVEKENALPDMQTFIASVTNGQRGIPAGVYVPGVLALKIVQQPKDNPAFVSAVPNILTQFEMASRYLTVGLLAHNFLAGTQFFKIRLNQEIVLVFGDGKLKDYSVSDIKSYQALSPNDPYSNFLGPDGQNTLSSEEVFKEVYAKGNQLVFQTCIQKGNEDSWGRLFIIANEMNSLLAKSFNLADYISVTHFHRAVVGTD
jgi:hypothetical protein